MTLRADTMRFTYASGELVKTSMSPNRGLESYLGEAYCRQGTVSQFDWNEVHSSVARILDEGSQWGPYLVWGWECKPSISNIRFPVDWDDTSKAIDFLATVGTLDNNKSSTTRLPDDSFWEEHLASALFQADEIGIDIKKNCRHQIGISVFF